MTRNEMLDAINIKIARTAHTEYSNIRTNYYLPVMIGDILHYMDRFCFWDDDFKSYDGHKSRDMDSFKEAIVALHYLFIRGQHMPLEQQDDDCIQYVYNLIK